MVSIKNGADSTLTGSFVKNGKFNIRKFGLEPDYYTLSVKKNEARMDFDIYLEPGKYQITVPAVDGKYLTVKTTSVIQNKLTDYYNLEDSVLYNLRQAVLKISAEISDPKNSKMTDSEFQQLIRKQNSAKARITGAITGVMNEYIDKHPQTDVIIHIISNMDYNADPETYKMIFDRLTPVVKNSPAGRELKAKLTQYDQPAQPKAVPVRH